MQSRAYVVAIEDVDAVQRELDGRLLPGGVCGESALTRDDLVLLHRHLLRQRHDAAQANHALVPRGHNLVGKKMRIPEKKKKKSNLAVSKSI